MSDEYGNLQLPNSESLLVHFRRIELLKQESVNMPSLNLDTDALCDLELLLNRGFFPLLGYMDRADYESVLENMRLADGCFWPFPITLAVGEQLAASLHPGCQLALRDSEGFMLAVLTVGEIWQPDLEKEARLVYGTTDPHEHPGVAKLYEHKGAYYVGGHLEGIHFPQHYDFTHLRRTPAEMHRTFSERGWRQVIGFQDSVPLHRMQREMLLSAAVEAGAKLLISPLIGPSFATDVGHFSLVRCYDHFIHHLPRNAAMLNLCPIRHRGAGPRGALLHAMINRNYGCSHFLVHEQHDDPFMNGKGYYPPGAALQALETHRQDIDIIPMPVRSRVYVEDFSKFLLPGEIKDGVRAVDISQEELRRRLDHGLDVPEWYSFPEVIEEMCRAVPPKSQQGFTLFLTGLSGAGKSTVAKVLYVKLLEIQGRPVTLLDGDIVRRNLSSELTFTKEHRNLNVSRIGYVASEITKNRGIAICAPIAPYDESRLYGRELVSQYGGYILIYMATPLEVCEQRDRKGLYAKAKAGVIKGVTGIDDPYEVPANAEIVIDTTELTPSEAAEQVLRYLREQGYIN